MSGAGRRPPRAAAPSASPTPVSSSEEAFFSRRKTSPAQVQRLLEQNKIDEIIQILLHTPTIITIRKWVSIYIDLKATDNWINLFHTMAKQGREIASLENIVLITRGVLSSSAQLETSRRDKLVTLLFELSNPNTLANFITEDPHCIQHIVPTLKQQSPKAQETYYLHFILECMKHYQLDSLQELRKANPNLFDAIAKQLQPEQINIISISLKLNKAQCILVQQQFQQTQLSDDKLLNALTDDPDHVNKILFSLPLFTRELQFRYLKRLMLICAEHCLAETLAALAIGCRKGFSDVLDSIEKVQKDAIQALLSPPKATQQILQRYMHEFTHGFGNITHEGILLSCAQIATRKKYKFNPSVIKPEEFANFLEDAKKLLRPTRIHFILRDSHCTTGIIEITQDGHANLLYIDPKGAANDQMDFSKDQLTAFATAFPQNTIYYSREKRQNSGRGCTMYALDDVRHLFTTDAYLQTDIFSHLKKQNKTPTKLRTTNVNITVCDLPLTLLRTKQSTSLFADITARSAEEQKQVVSKKGWTAKQHADHDIRAVDNPMHPKMNLRLSDKLKKLAQQNYEFIIKTHPAEIERLMQQFTLKGFQARAAMAQQSGLEVKLTPNENYESLQYADATLTRELKHAGTFYSPKALPEKISAFEKGCFTPNASNEKRKQLCELMNLISLCHSGAYDDLSQLILASKFDVNTTFSYKSPFETYHKATCLLTIAKEQHDETSKTYQTLVKLGATLVAPQAPPRRQ